MKENLNKRKKIRQMDFAVLEWKLERAKKLYTHRVQKAIGHRYSDSKRNTPQKPGNETSRWLEVQMWHSSS